MELIFFIIIGIGVSLFLKNSSGSGESINLSLHPVNGMNGMFHLIKKKINGLPIIILRVISMK